MTPRLRTAEGALALIKENDPGTAVTLRQIRRLINTGAVPHIPVGRKKLVNVDQLFAFLDSDSAHFPQGGGADNIVTPYLGRRREKGA